VFIFSQKGVFIMKNIIKRSAILKIAGIVAIAAVIGFLMLACDDGETSLPGVPTGVTAVRNSTTPSIITVSWTAVTGATGYNVYWSGDGTGNGLLENDDPTTATTFQSVGNPTETASYFRVTAVNSAGEGTASAWFMVAAVEDPVLPPTAPTGVTAVRNSTTPSIITVSWTAVTGATGYNVYWSGDGTGNGLLENDDPTTATTFQSVGNPTETASYFRVTAVNSAGEGTASAWIQVAPVSLPAAPTGVTAVRNSTIPSTITVSWNAVSGAVSYNVYWATSDTGTNLLKEGENITATTFQSVGNPTNSTSYFRVTAVNSAGEGTASDWVPVGPVVPAAIQAGLYLGAPETITASSTRIPTVAVNNVLAACNYITDNASAGEYTLFLDNNTPVTIGNFFVRADFRLTIIGLGSERIIRASGTAANTADMFEWSSSNANENTSITIGENITLQGRTVTSANSLIWVRQGTFTMLEGSKITGHTTSNAQGAVYVASNGTFNMIGGEITGNHSTSNSSTAVGGVRIGVGVVQGFFHMTGGSITGNTRDASMQPMDVLIDRNTMDADIASRTGGIIGVANPPPLAGGGTELVLGLYAGTPGSITASSVPIASIPPHRIHAALITYINANAGPHTLLVGTNITIESSNMITGDLTIVGVGGERILTPTSTGIAFAINDATGGGSLTLGNNITIQGRTNATTHVIRLGNTGSFTMLAGSKITGSVNSHATQTGAVYIAGNATFTMNGGEISGNHSSHATFASAAGGVQVDGATAKFIMTGGTITGNTRRDPAEPMDVYFANADNKTFFDENKTGGTVGTIGPTP